MHTDFQSKKKLYASKAAVCPSTNFYIHTESKTTAEYSFSFTFFFCLAQANVQVPVQTIYETVILQDKLKKIT